MIAVMVPLSVSLGFIQEPSKAADALRRMMLTNATVRRTGTGETQDRIDVPIEQLVPGDIVLLSAGDMIPADVRLISTRDLFVNQSALAPVQIRARPGAPDPAAIDPRQYVLAAAREHYTPCSPERRP